MATVYLDASAIVKRYLRESGSQWITDLWKRTAEVSLFSAELVDVEVICALSRAERAGRIGLNRRNKSASLYLLEAQHVLDHMSITAEILQRAHRLALRHPLRAYDAMHLATALHLAERLSGLRLPAPAFVSADGNVLAAARAEGLTAEDPNEHE
jgi:predicted nucleic acid-binding protein